MSRRFIFPFPPSVNSMYMQGKNHGQKFPTKKLKEYKKALQDIVGNHGEAQMEGNLKVSLMMVPPDARARDADNYVKAVLDGLTQSDIIEDDSQIKQLQVTMARKHLRYNKGLVYVVVETITDEELELIDFASQTVANEILGDPGLPDSTLLYFIKPTKKNPL